MKLTYLKGLSKRISTFGQTEKGQTVVKVVRAVFLVAIIGYLALKLTRVGWAEILAELPTNPLFYVLFCLLFMSLPVTEIFIYRLFWEFPRLSSLPVFVMKRLYNKEVMGYSGEVYFLSWARNAGLDKTWEVAKVIRDTNIVSSVASTFIAVVLTLIFLTAGKLTIQDLLGGLDTTILVGAGVVTVVAVLLAYRVRRHIFSMSLGLAAIVFGIHCVRLVVGQGLQIGQWASAMPEVPIQIWFTMTAASIIVSRIPLIPSRDLIFLGAGIELSSVMGVSEAAVASMLVVISVLNKLVTFVLFPAISIVRSRQRPDDRALSNAPVDGGEPGQKGDDALHDSKHKDPDSGSAGNHDAVHGIIGAGTER